MHISPAVLALATQAGCKSSPLPPCCSAAPCVHIFPAVLALATNFQGYAAFGRLLGDSQPELLQELGILEVGGW